MSYQVGSACYATLADAGAAACVLFTPVSSVSVVSKTTTIKTITCKSSSSSGVLNLLVSTNDSTISANGLTYSYKSSTLLVPQTISYQLCTEGDYLVAFELIIGSVLSFWAVIYCWNLIRNFLDSSRGDQS